MNKSFLLLLIAISLLCLRANAQSYSKYMKEGKDYYNKTDYMTALERFDLAYDLANNQAEKNDAKSWKNKSRDQIKQQQSDLKKALQVAKDEREKTQKALDELNYKTYFMRSSKYYLNKTIVELCDELLKRSNRNDSLMWLTYKAQSFGNIGEFENAVNSLSLALKIDSSFLQAKMMRIYYYHALNELLLSYKDAIDVFLEDSSLLYTGYIAFNLCRMGFYNQARDYFVKAIKNYQPGIYPEAYLTSIPSDLEVITNQKDIYIDGFEFYKAHYYQLLGIKAYSGEKDFEITFKNLDSLNLSKTAYLYILVWTWDQEKSRPEDYGVYVMQGAMWEKAEYPNWALSKYEKFKTIHKLKHEMRYESINQWVDKRIHFLKKACTKEELIIDNKNPAPKFLYLSANELCQQAKYNKADSLINIALVLDSMNIEFLLLKAQISNSIGEYLTAIRCCDKILELAPNTSIAYFNRALANYWIDFENKDEMVINDLLNALKFNPYDVGTLRSLSQLISDSYPSTALSLLMKARQIVPNNPDINKKIEILKEKIR